MFVDPLGPGRDRVRDRERPARHVRVQKLDHFAVELNGAPASVFRPGEGVDDGAGARDLGAGGGEHLVADVDLAGMDERLAVESHVAPLQAFGPEPFEVLDVVKDPIDDIDAMGAGGDHATRETGERGGPPRREPRPGLLGAVVEPPHSGPAPAAAIRSSGPHCVCGPLTRITTSRPPKSRLAASMTWARAISFESGATESSRSRMSASAGSVAAFANALALEPGM